MIGHEITHGFDDNGRQYDKDGNRLQWWSSETIDKFVERKTCIVNQYSNYILKQINISVRISPLMNSFVKPIEFLAEWKSNSR